METLTFNAENWKGRSGTIDYDEDNNTFTIQDYLFSLKQCKDEDTNEIYHEVYCTDFGDDSLFTVWETSATGDFKFLAIHRGIDRSANHPAITACKIILNIF